MSGIKAMTGRSAVREQFARRPVCEKPTLNETRPPAAIAKRRVVFRVMNAELNNMRCRHATFTTDMPPDGFSIRQLFMLIELFERDCCATRSLARSLTPRFIAPDALITNFFSLPAGAQYGLRLFPFRSD